MRNNNILFASDLDNTLIFSYKKIYGDCVCVEMMGEKELSFMTRESYEKLLKIEELVDFVPVTTRSIAQYNRIDFFNGKKSKIALVANGGILLENGEINLKWHEDAKKLVQEVEDELEKGKAFLENNKDVYFDIRFVDELFIFTKSSKPKETVQELKAILNEKKVFIDNNGDKVYIFPLKINKGDALRKLADMLGDKKIIAAGDSLFDIPMLNEADIRLIPKINPILNGLNQNGDNRISKEDDIKFGNFVVNSVLEEWEKYRQE